MAVTLFGIVTLVRLVLPRHARLPMLVTGRPLIGSGMLTSPPAPVYPVIVTALLELDHTQPSEVVPVAACAAAGNVSNSSRATAASRRSGQMESLLWDATADAG